MLHPSYTDLNSRYSIVLATSKRARQIINGAQTLVDAKGKKPLSVAIEELNTGKVKIVGDDEDKL
jgi:DNA-directed RNA polymerase subunit omega